MSDTTGTAPASTPQPTPTAPPPTGQPASAAPADLFASPLSEDPVVSRGFAENLRAEGLKYRTDLRAAQQQLQRYDSVFGAYDAADQQTWLDLASTWASDPNRAAQVMQQIAQAVLGEESAGSEHTPTSAAPTSPEAGGLSVDQVAAMIGEAMSAQQQAVAEDQAVAGVMSEVRASGYDPDTADGFMVLYYANHATNGDIAQAAAMMRARDQAIIDNYVAGRANGAHPTPSPTAGIGATAPPQVGSWSDQRRAAQRYVDAVERSQ